MIMTASIYDFHIPFLSASFSVLARGDSQKMLRSEGRNRSRYNIAMNSNFDAIDARKSIFIHGNVNLKRATPMKQPQGLPISKKNNRHFNILLVYIKKKKKRV